MANENLNPARWTKTSGPETLRLLTRGHSILDLKVLLGGDQSVGGKMACLSASIHKGMLSAKDSARIFF